MDETLTVTRLGIRGKPRRTLGSTDPCESMIETVGTTQRNVKHWSSGEMGLRWTADGMLEAEERIAQVQETLEGGQTLADRDQRSDTTGHVPCRYA
jgi:putative transposase